LRKQGKAFIPEANEAFKALCKVNKDMVGFVQNNQTAQTATLDMDATLVETDKADALQNNRANYPLIFGFTKLRSDFILIGRKLIFKRKETFLGEKIDCGKSRHGRL